MQESQLFARNDSFICNAIISELLVISDVDSYSISADSICLCLICYKLLLCGKRPKFEILNGLPYIKCQFYPLILANFSMAKEVAIICAYPVVFILKLRPSRAFNPIAYTCIKNHTVLFPQNLVLLLNLLFSLTLALYNVICII